MSDETEQGGGKLGFLDSLTRLFRRSDEAHTLEPQAQSAFAQLEADFETALRGLNEKIEERRREAAPTALRSGPVGKSAEERAAEKQHRMEACHRAMRESIEEMHARLGTGLKRADLDGIARFLMELDSISTEGGSSHSLLPRARYAIAERLRAEAGKLAVARLLASLAREKLSWPDPIRANPSATEEEIDRSRKRRLAEVRESFLAQDFQRTSERMLGIVPGWGGDYPDPGSPLWEECVLEGVAAGLRGQMLQEFVELLRRDRELLLTRTETSIGKELAALQAVLQGGVRSIEQANEAVASSLRILDEVVPEIAWEQIRARRPNAGASS